jgi:hypothetical protein
MSPRLGVNIAAHRGKVDLPLVTEGIVETLSADPQRAHEHLGRGTLEPMLPEHVDRCVQRLFLDKFFWSRHARDSTLLWNDQSITEQQVGALLDAKSGLHTDHCDRQPASFGGA